MTTLKELEVEMVELDRRIDVLLDQHAEQKDAGVHADEANAHLIAAAPDLYAALEAMTGMYASMCDRLQVGNDDASYIGTLRTANDALEKARGESS